MNKKNKVLYLLMAFIILFSSLSVSAKSSGKATINGIIINDHIVYSDVEPYIKNDRTCVPIRFIAEELGYKVSWNSDERKVTMTNGSTEVELKIDSDQMLVNDKAIKIDAPAEITEDRTFVPLRAITEAFGEKVDFSDEYRIVFVGKNPNYSSYYKVVYYYENANPVISTYTINLAENKMDTGGDKKTFQTIDQLLGDVNADFKQYKTKGLSNYGLVTYKTDESLVAKETSKSDHLVIESTVPKEMQIKDDHYIAPTSDPLVGTWYGPGKYSYDDFDGIEIYQTRNYSYIESLGNNKYKITSRVIADIETSAEYWTVQYGTYDSATKTLKVKKSVETYGETGFFVDAGSYNNPGTYYLDNNTLFRNKIGSETYLNKY